MLLQLRLNEALWSAHIPGDQEQHEFRAPWEVQQLSLEPASGLPRCSIH